MINAKKCDASIPQDELIAYAKDYLKKRGYKKKNKRWTKDVGDFTLCFYIQGSVYGGVSGGGRCRAFRRVRFPPHR